MKYFLPGKSKDHYSSSYSPGYRDSGLGSTQVCINRHYWSYWSSINTEKWILNLWYYDIQINIDLEKWEIKWKMNEMGNKWVKYSLNEYGRAGSKVVILILKSAICIDNVN